VILTPATAGGHDFHLLANGLVIGATLIVLVVQLCRGRRGGGADAAPAAPHAASAHLTVLLTAVALAVLGAATIHLAATPVHLRENLLLGAFFLVLSALQFGYAAAVLVRPGETLLRLGVLVNAAVVALWVYTRTFGIPFGVNGGEIEAVGSPDLLATIFGLAAVIFGGIAVRQLRREQAVGRFRPSQAQLGYALAIVATTSALVSTTGIS
jgi:hypothetical protein